MSKYTILGPIQAPEKCYLLEVLLWRAFGRFPEEAWTPDGPWRFDQDVLGDSEYSAPIWNDEDLSDEECRFAGILPDPRTKWRIEDRATGPPSYYRKMIELTSEGDGRLPPSLSNFESKLEESLKFEAAMNAWLPIYQEYVDEFQNEICLDLRRGRLVASGTAVPYPNYEEVLPILNEQNIWLNDLDVVPVPAAHWISSNIKWTDSALFGRQKYFIWIHVNVTDMMDLYPPELLIKAEEMKPLGENFAVASSVVARRVSPATSRGRPPFPWDLFHVQVAKMYRDGEIPAKKEAAIAMLQEWFKKETGKSPSRAAIGPKLKPYFDELKNKDRNS